MSRRSIPQGRQDASNLPYTPGERDAAALVEHAEHLGMPANTDAEMGVIGSIYLDNEFFPAINALITAVDFYIEKHRVLFATMQRLYERGEPIDVITVAEELRATDQIEAAGGLAYATGSQFINLCASAWRGIHYATIIKDHADKRRFNTALSNISQQTMLHSNVTAQQAIAVALGELQPMADALAQAQQLDGGILTLDALMRMETPDMAWPVSGILPEGLCIVGAPPKTGKSALALQLALSIASGGPALGNAITTQGDVLYLALEDSPARLKERVERQLCGEPVPQGVHIKLTSPAMLDGGLVQIESWLRSHPDAQAVIIDTLGRFRGVGSQTENGNLFNADYEDMARLQRLAMTHHVAIIALHHLTKNKGATDPLEALSGTMGLSAPADVVWILSRERNQETGQLQIVGRDVPEQNIAVKMSSLTLTWQAIGDAADVATSEGVKRVLDALKQIGHAATPTDIATVTGEKIGTVKTRCFRMKADGLLVTVGTGKYWSVNPRGLHGLQTVTDGS